MDEAPHGWPVDRGDVAKRAKGRNQLGGARHVDAEAGPAHQLASAPDVVALAQSAVLAEARERSETLAALLDLARVLAEARSVHDVAQRVAQAATVLVHGDRAVVVVWDPEERLLVRCGSWGPELRSGALSAPLPAATAQALALRGEPVLLGADAARGLRSVRAVAQMDEALLVPMVAGGDLQGAVMVPVVRPPGAAEHDRGLRLAGARTRPFAADRAGYLAGGRAERLVGLAGLAATAISNAVLLERICHQAEHDAPTGLPNLRLVDRLARVGLADASRRQAPVAVLFVDLDDFKSVNDRFGRASGDRLLVEAACRLRAAVRGADTVGRVGGDEFVVVLTQIGHLAGAQAVAERIVRTFGEPFLADDAALTMGASVGVAMSGPQDVAMTSLLARADAAMYRAKQAGRNRIGIDGGPVVDPLCT